MDMRSAAVNALWGAASAALVGALSARAAGAGRRAGACAAVVPAPEQRHVVRTRARVRQRPLCRGLPGTGPSGLVRRHGAARASRGARRSARADADPDVERLVPTSGSTAAAKLVPFTADLRGEFTTAIDAWLVDLFMARPALMGGPAYWSISPAGFDRLLARRQRRPDRIRQRQPVSRRRSPGARAERARGAGRRRAAPGRRGLPVRDRALPGARARSAADVGLASVIPRGASRLRRERIAID